MSKSGEIQAVGPPRELLDRVLHVLDTSVRLAMSQDEIPGDIADRVAANSAQLSRQAVNQILWDAYREGTKRGV